MVHLLDSSVVIGCPTRRRSTSYRLALLVKRANALEFATGIISTYDFTRSLHDPQTSHPATSASARRQSMFLPGCRGPRTPVCKMVARRGPLGVEVARKGDRLRRSVKLRDPRVSTLTVHRYMDAVEAFLIYEMLMFGQFASDMDSLDARVASTSRHSGKFSLFYT